MDPKAKVNFEDDSAVGMSRDESLRQLLDDPLI